jgi:hypothetical protein
MDDPFLLEKLCELMERLTQKVDRLSELLEEEKTILRRMASEAKCDHHWEVVIGADGMARCTKCGKYPNEVWHNLAG